MVVTLFNTYHEQVERMKGLELTRTAVNIAATWKPEDARMHGGASGALSYVPDVVQERHGRLWRPPTQHID